MTISNGSVTVVDGNGKTHFFTQAEKWRMGDGGTLHIAGADDIQIATFATWLWIGRIVDHEHASSDGKDCTSAVSSDAHRFTSSRLARLMVSGSHSGSTSVQSHTESGNQPVYVWYRDVSDGRIARRLSETRSRKEVQEVDLTNCRAMPHETAVLIADLIGQVLK